MESALWKIWILVWYRSFQTIICTQYASGLCDICLKIGKKKFEIDKTIEEINLAIQSVNLSIPSEFTRKPRSLDLIHFWKALESRTFLLYYGPVLIKNFLPEDKMNHFLYFSCAIRILANSTSTEQDIKYANDLLAGFLKGFKDQYPVNKITYIRWFTFRKMFSKMDHLIVSVHFHMRTKVHKYTHPLQQIYNRQCEREYFFEEEVTEKIKFKVPKLGKTIYNTISVLEDNRNIFSSVQFLNMKFWAKNGDNYCCVKNFEDRVFEIVEVTIENNMPALIGHYLDCVPLFDHPISSLYLGINKILPSTAPQLEIIYVENIDGKMRREEVILVKMFNI
jgi:hypothetical protein